MTDTARRYAMPPGLMEWWAAEDAKNWAENIKNLPPAVDGGTFTSFIDSMPAGDARLAEALKDERP